MFSTLYKGSVCHATVPLHDNESCLVVRGRRVVHRLPLARRGGLHRVCTARLVRGRAARVRHHSRVQRQVGGGVRKHHEALSTQQNPRLQRVEDEVFAHSGASRDGHRKLGRRIAQRPGCQLAVIHVKELERVVTVTHRQCAASRSKANRRDRSVPLR